MKKSRSPRSFLLFALIAALLLAANLALAADQIAQRPSTKSRLFYSDAAREHEVSFRAIYRSKETSLESFQTLTEEQKSFLTKYEVSPLLQFLFGPLTHRNMGGPQRLESIALDWSSAQLVNGKVEIPYEYRGVWILEKAVAAKRTFELPVPFNKHELLTAKWKSCTDSEPEHQTMSYYWYYWDPKRFGCDHVEGEQYQHAIVQVGAETPNQSTSMPEYDRLIRTVDGKRRLSMTIAFGYVEDPESPEPDYDWDQGMREYRMFLFSTKIKWGFKLSESVIRQGEYRSATNPELAIGRRFEGVVDGVHVTINAVTAAGIDQMELFAKSFAHDHDGIFAWFGHSRVGAGFDAQEFGRMLRYNPEYYSVTNEYQVVYWGGCNSYSYYTLPFFEFKAAASGGADPRGTKNLDIVANGLPSYFNMSSEEADIFVSHFMSWQSRPTYQRLINAIELEARRNGVRLLAAVLGDEDNQPNVEPRP